MLIKDTEEVNKWFPNSTFPDGTPPRILSYLMAAERTFLVPVLGTPLYVFLQQEYDSPAEDKNALVMELLELSQAVVVLFGIYGALPALNVTINKMGGLTVATNSNTTVASKDRTDKLIESTYVHANQALEQLLLFMEKNSSAFKDAEGAELWKQSEYYWQKTGCLIFTAAEFNNIVYIDNSRIKFNRLYPSIRLMERTKLRPAFGRDVITRMIEKKMNRQLTDTDRELLEHMQTALALLTVSQDEELSRPGSIRGYKTEQATLIAESEIEMAKNILRKHPVMYPDYYENAPGFQATPLFKNDDKKSIFVIGGPSR